MWDMRTRSDYGVRIHRVKTIHKALALAAALILVSAVLFLVIGRKNRTGNERKNLLEYWEAGSYDRVYSASGAALNSRPLDYFFLTLHGFSAYQLGVAQINSADTLGYIDESIWSLRKAMLLKNSQNDGRVYYVLGKGYYYKGTGYADLAVRYLEKARSLRYRAADISEYLGLAHAALRDYRGSVEAFSQALAPEEGASPDASYPSDMLLLSIARSYLALEELDSAQAYLARCIEVSRDIHTRVAARLLLGEALGKNGDAGGAEFQYGAVLEEADDNAEAHYQLGELYSARGDVTRARAEWRRAYRLDPSHGRARTRLGI
ncbi:MAG: tetratricopeptide repeat protein [Treponema sp.]|jgi:tetratricopeptide (TPR) repeat protein|nr:tetratricopeptide repeat protein [Treponema sp.]